MPEDQYTQCLLLVVHKGDQKEVRKSRRSSSSCLSSVPSTAKAFAILPEVFRNRHPNIVNLFQRNDIYILSNDCMLSLPFFQNNELEIIEIFLDESSVVSSHVLSVSGVSANKEVVKLLFCRTAVRFDSVPYQANVCPAVDDRNINVIRCLLTRKAAIHCRHTSGESLLHLAAERGPQSLVRLILEHGANVNTRRSDGWTSLHLATASGLAPIVRLLIKSGADVNCRSNHGSGALFLATHRGFSEVVEILLQNGADANAKTDILGRTPILIAAEAGNIDLIEVLSKYGADVDVKSNAGTSVLESAYFRKHPDVFKYLLERFFLNFSCLIESGILQTFRDTFRDPPPWFFDVKNFQSCFRIFVVHLTKIVSLNFNVVDEDKELSLLINETLKLSNLPDCKHQYELEADRLRKKTLGDTDLSFYDVLTKDPSKVACWLRNDTVAQIAFSGELQNKFPIYGNILMHLLRKGRERKLLLEDGIKICNYLFSHFKKLPHELKEEILNYLAVRDLLILKSVITSRKATK